MGEDESSSGYVDYGRQADSYQSGRTLSPASLARWGAAVAAQLPGRPLRVVDVGAGTGFFADAWQRWVPASVVAVEPNLSMIQAGHPGVRYVRGVAERLPLASRVADVVWISTALHHFADLSQALGECRRVLREGGRVLVRTFLPGRTGVTWLGVFPGYAKALNRFMTLDQLAETFARHGLAVEHVVEVPEEVRTCGESADWVELMRKADTMLTALTDAEIAEGLRVLRAEPARLLGSELSLVVFRQAG